MWPVLMLRLVKLVVNRVVEGERTSLCVRRVRYDLRTYCGMPLADETALP